MFHFLTDIQAILRNASGSEHFQPRHIVEFDIILFFTHEVTFVNFEGF